MSDWKNNLEQILYEAFPSDELVNNLRSWCHEWVKVLTNKEKRLIAYVVDKTYKNPKSTCIFVKKRIPDLPVGWMINLEYINDSNEGNCLVIECVKGISMKWLKDEIIDSSEKQNKDPHGNYSSYDSPYYSWHKTVYKDSINEEGESILSKDFVMNKVTACFEKYYLHIKGDL